MDCKSYSADAFNKAAKNASFPKGFILVGPSEANEHAPVFGNEFSSSPPRLGAVELLDAFCIWFIFSGS